MARANPLSKLTSAALLTLAVLVTVDWVSAAVVLALELLLLPLLHIRAGTLLRRISPLLVAALIGAWGTALLAEKTGAVLFAAGPLIFTSGSVAAGIAIGLRGLAIALPGIYLLTSTDPTDLADALAQKLRLPHRFVLGALAAMRLVGLLVEEWRTIGLARHARGAGPDAGAAARLKGFAGQALALLVQAIRRATRLAVAMEARGFGAGDRSWARTSTFSRIDAAVLATGVVVSAAAVAAALAAGTFNFILT
ncbi:energy-coupling factor transporter transmembrane protein EcfT [Arthrobacter sp. zg-Y20]|uniref:energy-coupling factor transporter transmembrane component T family protein n=1 Tax=Arthrobacter sp. zg-Y20 TaxID=2886938 RepID=UPI001D14BBB0|nr:MULTISPECIES: energy-coupling factor transporter transmembrane component T [unclassified Arthrobacter]MCC3275149.1 energy-coupling factor transporter transmembrane protein EcfT [Arthrobacter sp. zg-Y20]MDK1315306.1 energy-coupling factor transporter transmembrane component T [Arthrobacter sp. zg.Y20]MDK1326701.1 energy-coupling factor transporter transmembrane component T [Arthrobacter sp. zg-Y1143]WIB07884.1 energy-coupling factor transporter transmembrane component T [Arthrobacter sp. zg-Y